MEVREVTSYQVTDIFKATPRDEIKEVIESPPVEINDFDIEAMKVDYIESPEEEAKNMDPQTLSPGSEPKTLDVLKSNTPAAAEESSPINLPEPVKREVELAEKSKEFQSKLVKVIKPGRIIGFMDMILSRVGPMVMRRSEKADWKLDADEKAFLADALDAMVEEEGIMFWPAKVWLILAIIFFYGMKTYDVYADYYTKRARELKRPEDRKAEFEEAHKARLANLDILEMEVIEAEREAELNAKLMNAQKAKKAGLTVKEYEKQLRKEQLQESRKETETVKLVSDIELEYPPEDYPEDTYVYIDGELQFNKDGSPSKKRGAKPGSKKGSKAKNPYRHPSTGQLMSKSSYFKLYEEQPELWEDKTPTHLENGVREPQNDVTDVEWEEIKTEVA